MKINTIIIEDEIKACKAITNYVIEFRKST